MRIEEYIKCKRQSLGYSQKLLAERLEISKQAVSKWENDQSAPDSIKMIRLAEVLDTDIEYLSTGRRSYGRRPPVVLTTTEVVEKVIEKHRKRYKNYAENICTKLTITPFAQKI